MESNSEHGKQRGMLIIETSYIRKQKVEEF